MALSSAEKNRIHHRANGTGGQEQMSGSELASIYGVSASMISNIKNHYTPTVDSPSRVSGAVSSEDAPAPRVLATRKVIVHSPKFTGKEFNVVAVTFGQLLDEIGEDSQVEGIYKDSSRERHTLSGNRTVLPATGDAPLHLYLAPLKTDAGK